jgi:hypothetical protein
MNGVGMKKSGRSRHLVIALVISLHMFASAAFAQYSVGQTIAQVTRDRVVTFCANDAGNISLGELLAPEPGVATRVVWLNFFESW